MKLTGTFVVAEIFDTTGAIFFRDLEVGDILIITEELVYNQKSSKPYITIKTVLKIDNQERVMTINQFLNIVNNCIKLRQLS